MGNSGKNSNSCNSYYVGACTAARRKHVVFGRVVAGMDVVRAVEAVAGEGEKPRAPVVICACGVFEDDTPPRGYWAPASVEAHADAPPSFMPAPTLVLVVGPAAAADRARAALVAAHLRADVVAAPDADAADRVDAVRWCSHARRGRPARRARGGARDGAGMARGDGEAGAVRRGGGFAFVSVFICYS